MQLFLIVIFFVFCCSISYIHTSKWIQGGWPFFRWTLHVTDRHSHTLTYCRRDQSYDNTTRHMITRPHCRCNTNLDKPPTFLDEPLTFLGTVLQKKLVPCLLAHWLPRQEFHPHHILQKMDQKMDDGSWLRLGFLFGKLICQTELSKGLIWPTESSSTGAINMAIWFDRLNCPKDWFGKPNCQMNWSNNRIWQTELSKRNLFGKWI